MREVKAPSRPGFERRVFLAGSIEMGQAEQWQKRIVDALSAAGDLDPRRDGRALASLAEQPHRGQAVAWGSSGIYRLRLPGIRILYEVNLDAATIYVINVAVTA